MRVALVLVLVVVVVVVVVCVSAARAHEQHKEVEADWSPLVTLMEQGVARGVFPGAVAAVGNASGLLFSHAVGHFTYGQPAPVTGTNPAMDVKTTLFDMASCTKVLSTTTAVAQFVQRGELGLDWKIADPRLLGPQFAVNGKASITVTNVMTHSAGFPPDPVPNYWDPPFGCPATSQYHPDEVFNCQDKIYFSLLQQPLQNPVNSKYVYSDLSMITMMYVVGKLARDHGYVTPADFYPGCDQKGPGNLVCYYEAYVRREVFEPLQMHDSGFLPSLSNWGRAAPAWNDTTYRHRVVQGQVSDGNAYALGGISGHAGLFATLPDVANALFQWMYPDLPLPFTHPTFTRLTADTVSQFTRVYNTTQSSRALGWDTNATGLNQDHSCGDLSPRTFLHLGYTGTQVCNDPDRRVFTILLTNRVYPVTSNTQIGAFRTQFSTQVVAILDSMEAKQKEATHGTP